MERRRASRKDRADQREPEVAESDEPVEIAISGDLTEHESDVVDRLLSVPPGGQCILYIDSPGGSPYSALSMATLILVRQMDVTAIVTGECSSAALWPFAACRHRLVTPYSVLLFHPMKWQSEEHVGLAEAAEWARHFGNLERDMDVWLAELFGVSPSAISGWMHPGKYVSGRELVAAGLAELLDLSTFLRPTPGSTAAGESSLPLLPVPPSASATVSPGKTRGR